MARVWARLEGGPLDGQRREVVRSPGWLGALLIRPKKQGDPPNLYQLEDRITNGTYHELVYVWHPDVSCPAAPFREDQ